MRQVPLSPLSFDPQRVANVPQHPPPSTRLMSCARIANRQLPRIIGASPIGQNPFRFGCSATQVGVILPENIRTCSRMSSSKPREDDYDVLVDGAVVGCIVKAAAASVGPPWLWTLAFGHHEDRTPTHSYELTREDAMAAIRKEQAARILRKDWSLESQC